MLFSASAWIPFAASSALIAAIPGRRATHGGASEAAGRRTSLRAEIAEGLGSVGFGLLLAGAAAGGTLGSVVTPWLSRRLEWNGGVAASWFCEISVQKYQRRTDFQARGGRVDLKGHDGGVWADPAPPGSCGRPDR